MSELQTLNIMEVLPFRCVWNVLVVLGGVVKIESFAGGEVNKPAQST